MQVVDFILLVANFRAIAHLHYVEAVATDGLMCLIGWTFFKTMQREIDNWHARAGFVVGGMVGSLAGMWVTRTWG